jgi:antitoxin (DNA-binding transcriptional repressor) of toxin-antitoxin stability system
MKSVNISDARKSFSALLRSVRRGARIPIRERNRVVAWLVPAGDVEGPLLNELEAAGMVRRPLKAIDEEFLSRCQPLSAGGDLEKALLANREEDR